jgi:hypothetical protein
MPVLSRDCLSFSGFVWTFKLLPSKHAETAYGMQGYSPVHFRDQHMVSCMIKVKLGLQENRKEWSEL